MIFDRMGKQVPITKNSETLLKSSFGVLFFEVPGIICTPCLLYTSSTYSMSRLYSEDGYPNDLPSTYRYGQYFVANVFWNVTPNMQVGAESVSYTHLQGYPIHVYV